jgi:hypothetical protein
MDSIADRFYWDLRSKVDGYRFYGPAATQKAPKFAGWDVLDLGQLLL